MDRLRRLWPILFLLLVPLVAVGTALFSGGTIGAFDQIRQLAPWNGPKPAQPWDVLQADSVLQFYPWRDLVLSAWGNGDRPYWNPYQLAGTPLLANSQSAGFYPPHMVLGLLGVPASVAINLLAWFHLFWAGFGVALLVRSLRGSRIGAAMAGASFTLSPFMLAWTALPSVISTISWIPWVLAGIVTMFDRPRFSPGVIAVTALSAGMMILAGHLQFVAYGFLASGLLASTLLGTRIVKRDSVLPALAGTGLALGLGVMIALPQLLPVLNYSQFSHRRNTPTAEGYQAYIGSAINPTEFVARLVNPFGQGDPTEYVSDAMPVSTYWPALSRPGANFAESAVTLGPVVLLCLCLLPFCKVRWSLAAGIGVMVVVTLLLALGTPLNQLLYFYVPGWSSTGSPGRILSLVVLGACTLAGLAVPNRPQKTQVRGLQFAVAVTFLLGMLGHQVPAAPAPAGIDSTAWAILVGPGSFLVFPFTIIGIAIGAVAMLANWLETDPRAKYSLVAVPVVLALLGPVRLVRHGDASFLKPVPENQNRMAAVNDPWSLVSPAPAFLPPNTATAMRMHDLSGYDSLLHRDTVKLLNEINGRDSAPPANGNMMFIKPGADAKKLAGAGVSTRVSREGPETIAGPGRVSLTGGTAKISREDLDSIEIDVSGSGLLVLRDRNLPGWTAQADGADIPIEGTVWRELTLPAGAKKVTMAYVPPGLQTGIYAMLLGLLGIGVLAFLGAKPPRKTVTGELAPELAHV